MFHVERIVKSIIFKGLTNFLLPFFLLLSCVGLQQRVPISDYVIVPNGKEVLGNKNLSAFIFENNLKKLPIEQFLSAKFNTNSYSQNEFWITIDKNKYKMMIYDKADYEKYFMSYNFAVMNFEPENAKSNDQRTFIAISMINSNNEDCLNDNSLYQNIAVNYLKQLKEEFYNQ